jgi:chromate transporter
LNNNKRERTVIMLNRLFWTFFRIGPSTFGGGYAMLPIIEREIAEEVGEMISLAGSAPGGVGVNAAAIVGYRKAGVAGAAAAVAGVTCPTFLIVLLLSALAVAFQHNPKLEAALKGMHGAVIALIVMAAYRMARTAVFDVTTAVASIATVIVLLLANIHPLYVIVLGLVSGMLVIQIKLWLGISARTERQPGVSSGAELEYYI